MAQHHRRPQFCISHTSQTAR